MLPSHFISQHEGQLSWTLTTRLGEMLSNAQALYGRRDHAWTILGIEFHGNTPHIWFPGNCKHIAIRLTLSALNDQVRAYYQLAHESVHLLAPNGIKGAPVLEEGLAVVFAEDYIEKKFGTQNYTNPGPYVDAAKKVRTLLSFNPNAILALREVEPSFKQMTVDAFVSAKLDIPRVLIDELLAPFGS